MKKFERFEGTEVMKEIKRRYNIPVGKQPNIRYYEWECGKERCGRWHIQVKEGEKGGERYAKTKCGTSRESHR